MPTSEACFASIIEESGSAKIIPVFISADIDTPALFAEKRIRNIKANIINNPYCGVTIRVEKIQAKIINLIVLSSGGDDTDSIIFNFSNNDLVNGKLRRVHNFQKLAVDISVFDNINKEVMIGVEIIDLNTIELDFSRANINGVWKLLIEK
jgi:hypothetical protein